LNPKNTETVLQGIVFYCFVGSVVGLSAPMFAAEALKSETKREESEMTAVRWLSEGL